MKTKNERKNQLVAVFGIFRMHSEIIRNIGAGLTGYADSAVLSLTHTEYITESQGKTRRFSAFDSVTFDPRLSNIWSVAQKYFRRGSVIVFGHV